MKIITQFTIKAFFNCARKVLHFSNESNEQNVRRARNCTLGDY